MPSDPPISFDALAKSPGNPAAGGYPYSLRGSDLDKNFVFATADFDEEGSFEVASLLGAGGFPKRKIRLKVKVKPGTEAGQLARWNGSAWEPIAAPPETGTHVLGAVGGAIEWIATEKC